MVQRIKEDFLVGYLKNISRFVAVMTAIIAGAVTITDGGFGKRFAAGIVAFFCFGLALIPVSLLTRKEISFDDTEIQIGTVFSKKSISRQEISSLEYNPEEQILTIGCNGEIIEVKLRNYSQKELFLDYLSH